MSSNTSMYACPKCGNPNTHVERRPDGFCCCPECHHRWKIGESQPKPTVFDRIIASPEVLAPKFIYEATTCAGDGYILAGYRSTIAAGFWLAKSEAIAATVNKLKEVEK